MINVKILIVLMVFFLSSSSFIGATVHGQTETTLAEVIGNILEKVNLNNLSPQWGSVYSQIFGLANQTIFDSLIQEAVNQSDWQDAVWVARLAELNGYDSSTIDACLTTALERMPMCGSLPVTDYGANKSVASYPPEDFCVYDRYMVNAYRYAQRLGVTGWNITRAFADFVDAYLSLYEEQNREYGEMLWVNPSANFSASYSGRYYDEYAETLDMFLEFAENGVTGNITVDGVSLNATSFMDNMWIATQELWNGKFYDYNNAGVGLPASENIVECEMGNFAQTIAEYQNYRGELPYFDRVISDLKNTLLINNWSSPAWACTGVVKHAQSTPEQEERLPETLGEMIALQMLYPEFSSSMQSNFQNMLTTGWQGLINSPLFNNGTFAFLAPYNDAGNTYTTGDTSDDASLLGAMTLFIDGITPQTGSLALNASNERYMDYQTCFPINQWQFNYQNQTITIPIMAGDLAFNFGAQPITEPFATNGVYQIHFSTDWNSITSVTKVADINVASLNPAILQTQIRPTPSPTPTPISTPLPTSTPTSTPTPVVTVTPLNAHRSIDPLWYVAGATVLAVVFFSMVTLYLRKKSRSGYAGKV